MEPTVAVQRSLTDIGRLAIIVIFLFSLTTGDVALIANTALMLGTILVLDAFGQHYRYVFGTTATLLIILALLVHTGGVLGWYSINGFDHIAHFFSAFTVGILAYGYTRAVLGPAIANSIYGAVIVVIAALALGFVWEVTEAYIEQFSGDLLGEKILTQHGPEDTRRDLVFDGLGGAAVGLLLIIKHRIVGDLLD